MIRVDEVDSGVFVVDNDLTRFEFGCWIVGFEFEGVCVSCFSDYGCLLTWLFVVVNLDLLL